jgi:hypothetical protein
LSNQELSELEQKSWNKAEGETIITKAKKVIVREMVVKGKTQLAEAYLKKCLLTFSSNFDLLASILTAYANLIKKSYPGGSKVKTAIAFIIDQLKKASV